MFHAFRDNVIKAQRDVKMFHVQWKSPETQGIFEHTRKSAAANADLSAGAQVQQYGWIEKEEKDDGRDLLIRFAADSTQYRFRVTISDDANATQAIKAECEGAGEPFAAVTRCLASRPNVNDLKFLLVC